MRKVGIAGIVLMMLVLSAVSLDNRKSTKNFEEIEYAEIYGGKYSDAYYTSSPGKPMLPYYVKTYVFPLGTKVSIECNPKGIEKKKASIIVAPPAVAYGTNIKYEGDGEAYEIYPQEWYTINEYGGLYEGKLSTIVAIHLYPVRYIAKENMVEIANDFEIKITHDLPNKGVSESEKDLLIIYPSEWENEIARLIQHKEEKGLRVISEKVENIYSNYEGRDGAEKVKYFIKDVLEKYGIKYVMLVGGKRSYLTGNWGMDGATTSNDALWYCPVRYAALDDREEFGYLSDLYFADIYNADGSFSSWDTNGDGVFGAWSFKYGKDKLDLAPDVYVGRLACQSLKELQNVIDKIVNYENNAYGKEWFKKMLLIGGDTFGGNDVFEGEVSTSWFYNNYMASKFVKTSLYVSDGTLTYGHVEPAPLAGRFAWINVIKTWSNGFGFVAMDGHGSPTAWATHFKNGEGPWVNGLMTYNMDLLSNGEKQPIVVIGGCHNSEFNISLLDDLQNPWTYQPTYECFSWHLVKMANKGAIATFGNTGLGYGHGGGYDDNKNGVPDEVEYFGGFIEERFFRAYGAKGKDMLGEAWGTAIIDYIAVRDPMKDVIDCKTVEEWVLLGDPSLKIGGYP
ncbi:MAG: C25 family cysteine peptidase [Candidatus Thermoplasmatota archaeon]